MENGKLNKSMCEELFRGQLDVTEKPEIYKSEDRLYKVTLREKAAKEDETIQRVAQILKGKEDFCRSKKKMLLPIWEGIANAKEKIGVLLLSNASLESFLSSMEYFLGLLGAKDKEYEEAGKHREWGKPDRPGAWREFHSGSPQEAKSANWEPGGAR